MTTSAPPPAKDGEPSTGSIALAEVLADMTEADAHTDPGQPRAGDDLLADILGIERVISAHLPPGLWKATTKYDRTRLDTPMALPDLQIDAWDVESAREIAKHLPWSGPVQEHVLPGKGHDFYVWDGGFNGFAVRVIGPESLPATDRPWWSKPQTNEGPEGGEPQ